MEGAAAMVGQCSELCSACCGSLLANPPRAQAASRGLPGSRLDSEPFLAEMKLVKNSPSLPLVFLSQPGMFCVDHKFLHPFFFFLANVFMDDVVT